MEGNKISSREGKKDLRESKLKEGKLWMVAPLDK